jgi:hypothetical protein
MYRHSGYPEANLSFAEYCKANHAPQFIQVNRCIVFKSLATFLQVAKEEELKPIEAQRINQFKKIAYIYPTGEAVTA